MRKTRALALILAVLILTCGASLEAKNRKIPSVKIENLQGEKINARSIKNDGKPIVILFWATWCKPCITELKAYSDVYPDWQDDYGVKIVAVSIDNSRNARKVAPFVKGRGWDFDFYLDKNQDFARAMNVSNPPHSFLIDGKGNIVWQHNGYAPGDEEEMLERIQKLVKKKK